MADATLHILDPLETKALWLVAEIGERISCEAIDRDPELRAAAARALGKVYQATLPGGTLALAGTAVPR